MLQGTHSQHNMLFMPFTKFVGVAKHILRRALPDAAAKLASGGKSPEAALSWLLP